ncbi:MAG: methylornithine synthase PylB, partial [Proteobacteria bacterium]|nr:methylornithine synthase PylB [Pseudomonadota bacterium]
MLPADIKLTRILNGLQKGYPVEKNEITYLLNLSDPKEIDRVFEAARKIRTRYFGNKIFLYGFLYFSTFCRNECCFCQYRQSNTALLRYRKTREEILDAAREMADAGVHLIDLTMGEDPEFYASGDAGFKNFVGMVKSVQDATNLGVMISPGALPDSILSKLAAADVTWYACYQETHNKNLYKELRQGQRFEKRLAKKQLAKGLGMLIEEGIL